MIPLETDKHYHIFNRANGNETIFLGEDNYLFFLNKYIKHISPICDTFCYCLMPNHFHFLIRIKNEIEIEQLENFKNTKNTCGFLSKQFSNLFSSYTQAFNKQQGRKGSLFMRPFKRKEINSETYFRNLVYYIHLNPVEAGFCDNPKDWKYSSFNALITEKPTFLIQTEVLNYFDDLENFMYVHSHSSNNNFDKVPNVVKDED